MMRALLQIVTAGCLLGGCRTIPAEPPQRADLAIVNVTVVDPQTRRTVPGQSVYITGKRIVAIGPAGSERTRAAVRTIDGGGRFLIPGLMDMHVHLFLPEPPAASLNLLLANGVTGMREMSGDCWEIAGATEGCVGDYRRLQQEIRIGAVPGPEILAVASTMVMGPSRQQLPESVPSFVTPRTPDEARQVVRHLHARGVDLLKVHDSIPDAAFRTFMAEARALGIEVAGHLPFAAGTLGATQLGVRSIEHARDLLYDCSRYGAEFRAGEAAHSAGEAGATRPSNLARLQRTVAEFDPGLCATMLAQLAARPAFYVPTHVTREMEARAGEAGYRADPHRRYVLAHRNRNWEADLDETAGKPADERAALAAFFRHGLVVTGLAHRAGVPIMAGSDASDTMIVPGFSLHRELELLVEAGLSPMDALRAATTIPADYLRRSDDLGGIGVGKEADLVLLDGNPLDDIANVRRIGAVITDGRLYDRAALDALLAEVERMAAAPPTP